MNQTPNRALGWHWLAAATVVAALLFLNLDGYHLGYVITFQGRGDFHAEPPSINWCHGWPFTFMIRRSIEGPMPDGSDIEFSRWPVDGAPISRFHFAPLLLDVAIFLLLVAGVWFGGRRAFCGLPGLRCRFSVRHLFWITLLVSVALTLNLYKAPRQVLQYFVLALVALAVLVVVYGLAVAVRDWIRSHSPASD